ncbi:MAG: PKD domain-containing protein [Bacteroidetes bacterium]|nr:PKD domain-containing protein [Bacteroidota bacterium]
MGPSLVSVVVAHFKCKPIVKKWYLLRRCEKNHFYFLMNIVFLYRMRKLLLTGFCLISQGLFAQLSGNYTIGGTAGATNFAAWSDFTKAVSTSGVSGNVAVTVMSNQTITTAVQFDQNATNPTSSSKKITIDGNGKSLSGSLTYEVILFNGADFIEIKNLTIVNTGTSSSVLGVRFSGGADNNILNGCTVDLSGISSSTKAGAAYIAFASSQSSLSTTTTSNNGVSNTIQNCTLQSTGTNSPGAFYGIIDQQGTSTYKSTSTSNTFSGNTIKNFFKYAFYLKYVNGEQVLSNDISRSLSSSSCAVDTALHAVYLSDVFSSGRSNLISSNSIHDLPYKGASAGSTTNNINRFWGVRMLNVTGTGTYNTKIESNSISRIMALNSLNMIEVNQCAVLVVNKNSIYNCATDNSYSYVMNFISTNDLDVNNNVIRKVVGGNNGKSNGLYGLNCLTCKNSVWTWNRIENNVFDSLMGTDQVFGFYLEDRGSWQLNGNKLTNNYCGGNGEMYVMYLMTAENMYLSSNLIANNVGITTTYNMYVVNWFSGGKSVYLQNTIYARPSTTSGHVGFGYYIEDESEITFNGNILDMEGDPSSYGFPIDVFSSAKYTEVDYNTCYVKNFGSEYWGMGQNGYNDWGNWKSSGINGPNEYFGDPKWNAVSKLDFKSNCFENQNNVPTATGLPKDITGAARNPIRSDRGAFENFMDLAAVKTSYTLASQVCSGYTGSLSFTVKNNFVDTAYNFYVAYSQNGKATRQKVSTKILPKDSAVITFNVPMKLSQTGLTGVKMYIDIPDDKVSNDSMRFSTTVKPAPGGGVFNFSKKTQVGNNPVYIKAKPFDVTVLAVPVIYDIDPPRAYKNSDYGTSGSAKWNASVTAVTSAGKSVTGASLTAPSGSNSLELQFKTTDANLEDSMITLLLKISDLTNGCDTVLKRWVLISPTVNVDFSVPAKICNGDTVNFVNKSTYKSGYAENWWDFGTGNLDDTLTQVDGYFIFKKSGNYVITLRATTAPYGFVFTKKVTVVVNDIPKASFSKENACLGSSIKLTNQTTPTTAKMYWDFGDGNGYSLNNSSVVSVSYPSAGNYTVTLKADIGGCEAYSIQKVYQFEKPLAAFVKDSGRCDNEIFTFTNQSSISKGALGSSWYYNSADSNSNENNGKTRFYTPGKKSVKLVVKSEFGCKDSVTNLVTVFGAPRVDFTNTQPCSRTATVFKNITPAVTGAVPNYLWDFGDGSTSKSESPSHSWTALGKTKVTFSVNLDNGCKASISKGLEVLLQPKAAFTNLNPCSGDPVTFINESTTTSGTMTYSWDFSDNTTSTLESPKKTFVVKQTTNYNVTLTVYLSGGCADSITKGVSIQELPRTCDFFAKPDYAYAYYGVNLEPMDDNSLVGGQAGIDYAWLVNGVGAKTSKDVNASVSYDLQQDGLYTITLQSTVRGSGCLCSKTKQFQLNRADVRSLQNGVSVYPNPVNDLLHIQTNESGNFNQWGLYNSLGALVLSGGMSSNQNGIQNKATVDVAGLSSGIYLLKVSGVQGVYQQSIIVGSSR